MFLTVGVYELMHNNKTVSLKTINAVQQMSLYPELMASVLYQATGSNVCVSFDFNINFLTYLWIFKIIYCHPIVSSSFFPQLGDYWASIFLYWHCFWIARNICYCFICYKLAYEWNLASRNANSCMVHY